MRARPDSESAAISPQLNLLLSKLSATELAAFAERAELVTREAREVIWEKGARITDVYFPVTGMISLLTVLAGGISIEALTVGYEGVAGLPLFNGVSTAQQRAICQIGGEFYRVSARAFLEFAQTLPSLTIALHKYSQFVHDAMAQSAACNSMHLVEQRCGRWLLLCADAVRSEKFDLTQEFFGQMLAVRRSGVSAAIGSLQRKNLVEARYGSIRIIDRKGLTHVACECYPAITTRLRALMHDSAAK